MELELARRTIEHLPYPVVWIDLDGRVVHTNAAAREAGLEGRTVPGDIDPDMSPSAWRALLEDLDSPTTLQRSMARGDGNLSSVFATAWQLTPHLFAISLEAAQLTRVAERKLHAILDSCPAAVAISDGTRIIYCNPAHVDLLGYTPEELREMSFRDYVHPGFLTMARTRFERARHGHSNPPVEMQLLHKDGGDRMVQLTSGPLEDGTIMAVCVDVTAVVQLRCGMADHGRRATWGELASGVAQELHEPLRSLERDLSQLHAELNRLGAGLGTPAATLASLQDRLIEARRSTRRLAGLAEDLETYAQGGDHTAMPHDLQDILESALELAWPRLRRAEAAVFRDLAPCPKVMGNETHLVQLFVNLLLNAAQALEDFPGDRRVDLQLIHETPSDRVVAIVEDSGPGTPEELMGRLTEPFFTTRAGARGMGLSISHSVAETLGGRLKVRPSPTGGLRVVVSLPAWHDHDLAGDSLDEHVPRILVIDDDPLVLRTFQRLLRDRGDVTTLGGGREAVETLVADQNWDVVLCDLMMPEIGGDDLFEMVQERWPDLADRWAFITGGAFTGSAADFLRLTNAIILDKPVMPEDLHRTVSDFIRKRRG